MATTSYVVTVGTIPDRALRRHHRASGAIYVGTHQAVRLQGAHRPAPHRRHVDIERTSARGRHRASRAEARRRRVRESRRTVIGRTFLTVLIVAMVSVVVAGAWLSAPDAVAFAGMVQP